MAISEQIKKEIVNLYVEQKKSCTEVAKILNIGHSTVLRNVRKMGYENRSSGESLLGTKRESKLPTEEIIKLYSEEGMSSGVLSKRFNCSDTTILELLKSNGVKRRTNKFYITKDVDVDLVKSEYLKGNSMKDVSDNTSISYSCVQRVLREYDIIRTEDSIKSLKEHVENKRIDSEVEKEIIRLYLDEEFSTTKVGKIVGVSSTSVSNILKRNEFIVRSISESKKGVKIGTKLPVDEIISMYVEDDLSSGSISKEVGCSRVSVLNILHENGAKVKRGKIDYEYTNPFSDEIKKEYLSGKSINEVMGIVGMSYGGVRGSLFKLDIIRTEDKYKGLLGTHQSQSTKLKTRATRLKNKESGKYDHIYLRLTGYTYKDFKKNQPIYKKYYGEVRYETRNRQ